MSLDLTKRVRYEASERLDLDDKLAEFTLGDHTVAQYLKGLVADETDGRVFYGLKTDTTTGPNTGLNFPAVAALAIDRVGNVLIQDGSGSANVALTTNALNYIYAYLDETESDNDDRRFYSGGTEVTSSINTRITRVLAFHKTTAAYGAGTPIYSDFLTTDTVGGTVRELIPLYGVAVNSGNSVTSIVDFRPMFAIANNGAGSNQYEAQAGADLPFDFAPSDAASLNFTSIRQSLIGIVDRLQNIKQTTNWWDDMEGLNVGFTATPTSNHVKVGDVNFGLEFGTDPLVRFASGDALQYVRATDQFKFITGGVTRGTFTTSGLRIENTATGYTALTRIMLGVELLSAGMNTVSKYTTALKFMSSDPDLTTENPKLLAAIAGRATEAYDDNPKGGMALDFFTTPNNPGASSLPTLDMTIWDGAVYLEDTPLTGSFQARRLNVQYDADPVVTGDSAAGFLTNIKSLTVDVSGVSAINVAAENNDTVGTYKPSWIGAIWGEVGITDAGLATTGDVFSGYVHVDNAAGEFAGVTTVFRAYAPSITGTVSELYGMRIDAVTGGTTNYGLRILGATSPGYALRVDSGFTWFEGAVAMDDGVADDDYSLRVRRISRATSSYEYAGQFHMQVDDPPSSTYPAVLHVVTDCNLDTGESHGQLRGILFELDKDGAGDLSSWYGNRANFSVNGGTVDYLSAYYSGGGIASGTVTNLYGFHYDEPSVSGTLTTQYGVDISTMSLAATNFGVRIRGASPGYSLYVDSGYTRLIGPVAMDEAAPDDDVSLYIKRTASGATAQNPIYSYLDVNAAATGTMSNIFMYSRASNATGTTVGNLRGIQTNMYKTGDGNLTNCYGVRNYLTLGGGGTIASLVSFSHAGNVNSPCSVTKSVAFQAENLTTTGTLTEQIGFYVPSLSHGATNYGVKIDSVTSGYAIYVGVGSVYFGNGDGLHLDGNTGNSITFYELGAERWSIRQNATNELHFDWINSSKMMLDGSSGRYYLGIGTEDPARRLHVLDTTYQMRLAYDASSYVDIGPGNASWCHFIANTLTWGFYFNHRIASTTGQFSSYTGVDLTLEAPNGNVRVTVEHDTGKVGVGTVTPRTRLHVSNGDAGVAPGSPHDEFVIDNTADAGMMIATGASGRYGTIAFGKATSNNDQGGVTYDHQLEKMYLTALHAIRVTIDGNGPYVGINQQSPTHTLEVNGTAACNEVEVSVLDTLTNSVGPNRILMQSGGSGTDKFINFRRGGGGPSGNCGIIFSAFDTDHYFVYGAGGGELLFSYSTEATDNPDADSSTEMMRLTTDGKLGIGTELPQTRTHITGSSNLDNGILRLGGNNHTSGFAGITFYNEHATPTATSRNWRIMQNRTTLGRLELHASTTASGSPEGGTLVASFKAAGHFGINTQPATNLHLSAAADTTFRITSHDDLEGAGGTEHIATFEWEGQRNGRYDLCAAIKVRQDGTWSTVSTYYAPGAIEFYTQDATTSDAMAAPRMTIDHLGNVGIGTGAGTAPECLLHVRASDVSGTVATGTVLGVEKNDDTYIDIISGLNKYGGVLFGDAADKDVGRVRYNHNGNIMELWTAGAQQATLDATNGWVVSGTVKGTTFRATESKVLLTSFMGASFSTLADTFPSTVDNDYTDGVISFRDSTSSSLAIIKLALPNSGTVTACRVRLRGSSSHNYEIKLYKKAVGATHGTAGTEIASRTGSSENIGTEGWFSLTVSSGSYSASDYIWAVARNSLTGTSLFVGQLEITVTMDDVTTCKP